MSFFSFQDIICCVTGVLVLITLLMAIELARRPQTLGVNAQTTSLDWVTLNSQLKEAEKHRDNLTASLSRTQATLTQLSKTAVLTPGMLTDLRRRVEALRRSLQQQEASNSETQAEQARLAKEVSATQETRDALAERSRQLQQQIALARARVRVTLIGGKATDKKPYLVECSSNQVTVADVLPSGEARRVQQFSGKEAINSFLKWALSRDSSREYFILLVRPNAAGEFSMLRVMLQNTDFTLGWDVWPPEKSLFR